MGVPIVGRPSPSVEPSILVDSPENGRLGEFRTDMQENESEKLDTLKGGSSSIKPGEKSA